MASTALTAGSHVAPMRQRQSLHFPYKHSTGETVGRFLAGLKEQKKIWGQRVSGQGVVVPPLGYSEIDASSAGEWVEVKDTGVVTAAARVDEPIERLHPSATPFAFILVKLDGADTALAHIVKDDLDRVAVGARVAAVWAPDESRVGSIRDIACFRVIADAPQPKPRPAAKVAKPAAKAPPPTTKAVTAPKPKKAAKKAPVTKRQTSAKTSKPAQKATLVKKRAAARKPTKAARSKAATATRAAPAKARKTTKAKPSKKRASAKKPAKTVRVTAVKRPRRR